MSWYEDTCKENEAECFDYDLSKRGNRLKVFILGIFFNCIFKEEKAIRIFEEMEKNDYFEIDELKNFENNLKKTQNQLKQRTGRSHKFLKVQNLVDSVKMAGGIFSEEGDLITIFENSENTEHFLEILFNRLSGVKVKLFWICREFKDFLDISNEFCYVPDSHVAKFLYNIRFLRKKGPFSLEDYMQISRNMALYLDNKYFDLPYMRYHQEKCSKTKGCPCVITNCRFNQNKSTLENFVK